MKTIFTFVGLVLTLAFAAPTFAQCNYTIGGDATSLSAIGHPITIDGSIADWSAFLNDPDNNSYDKTNGMDLDGNISDVGRDLTRFSFTEDLTYFYVYVARAGSSKNSVDVLFYADINNNGVMELNEPVIHFDWSGSNGRVTIDLYNYVPAASSLLNSMMDNLDGFKLGGSLLYRGTAGTGAAGQGTVDGTGFEARIPLSAFTQLSAANTVLNTLRAGSALKFHLSTINGNVSSVPGNNSINDNFGGCLIAPPLSAMGTLPIKLHDFSAHQNNNQVVLSWTVSDAAAGDYFEVERSEDGNQFKMVGMVMTGTDIRTYGFKETMNAAPCYYRLKMITADGIVRYSSVVSLRASAGSKQALTLMQNPVHSSLNFMIETQQAGATTVNIYDISGAKRLEQTFTSSKGLQTYSIPLSSALPQGVYLLTVTNNTVTSTAKFMKQ